jgi:hypothetical protein
VLAAQLSAYSRRGHLDKPTPTRRRDSVHAPSEGDQPGEVGQGVGDQPAVGPPAALVTCGETNVEFWQGTIENVQLLAGSVDVVISNYGKIRITDAVEPPTL